MLRKDFGKNNYNTFESDFKYQNNIMNTEQNSMINDDLNDEYKDISRKHSLSISLSNTIPPSKQIYTTQKELRPLHAFIAHISEVILILYYILIIYIILNIDIY